MEEVYEEVYSLLLKIGVQRFKAKSVSRKYAFELFDIPRESDYLEVLYSYDSKFNTLWMDL